MTGAADALAALDAASRSLGLRQRAGGDDRTMLAELEAALDCPPIGGSPGIGTPRIVAA